MSRFFTILLVALTFSLVVWSHPVQADQSLVARQSVDVNKIVLMLTNLKDELTPEIESLKKHLDAHADTSEIIERIKAIVQPTLDNIAALRRTLLRMVIDDERDQIDRALKGLTGIMNLGSGSGVPPRGIGHEPRQGTNDPEDPKDGNGGSGLLGGLIGGVLDPVLEILGL